MVPEGPRFDDTPGLAVPFLLGTLLGALVVLCLHLSPVRIPILVVL